MQEELQAWGCAVWKKSGEKRGMREVRVLSKRAPGRRSAQRSLHDNNLAPSPSTSSKRYR